MLTWQAVHSTVVPACPWMRSLRRLSLRCVAGNSAWVEPWQASHCRPPWPREKRNSERPGAGVSGVVAKVWLVATRTAPLGSNDEA